MSYNKDLWITILDYLKVDEYPKILVTNKNLSNLLTSDIFRLKAKSYLDNIGKDLRIIEEEDDSHDDCGTSGTIIYLANGDIISGDWYDSYVYNKYDWLAEGLGGYFSSLGIDIYYLYLL